MRRYRVLSVPYLVWMSIFVFIPVILIFIMSFQNTQGVHISKGEFTWSNFTYLIKPENVASFGNSLKFSFAATIFCLLLGYPVAYIISKSNFANRFFVMAIMILPMWSNTLLRTKVIGTLFQPGNIVTDILSKININIKLDMYGSPTALVIGLVATYLPFMILPIYTVLEKIDKSCYDASDDLGANAFKTFWKVTLPISLKGITTGVILVFLPCATSFGVAEQLGNSSLIGSTINEYFKRVSTYGIGSIISLVILIIMTFSIFIVSKVDKEGETLL